MPHRIYLDHNATTDIHPAVAEAMAPYLFGLVGNASSLHSEGRLARRALEDARDQVAEFIGTASDTVTFTSGATEANNLAILGTFASFRSGGSGHLLVSAVEHPSVLAPAKALEALGHHLALWPVDSAGRLRMERAEDLLAPHPDLVAVMAANNEVGTLLPFEDLAALCANRGIRWHVDAVQWAGRLPLTFPDHPGGSMSISAHKFGGPRGIGALILHREQRIRPQILGGDQERGRRAGTESVALAVGLGAACASAARELSSRNRTLVTLEAAFMEEIQRSGVPYVRNGPEREGERLPGTVSLRLMGVSGETLLMGLDLLGLSVSLGSACSSGSLMPSHVLQAMGLNKVENLETIRVSFGARQTEADAREAARRIAAFVSTQLAI
jgi:cysteine desulfurase